MFRRFSLNFEYRYVVKPLKSYYFFILLLSRIILDPSGKVHHRLTYGIYFM